MPFVSKRPKLKLNAEEIEYLTSLSTSRTKPFREVERAKILLLSYQGKNDSQIAAEIGTPDEIETNRQRVIRCLKKALAYGIHEAIKDLPRSGKPPEITAEARAWIISIACQKPRDFGYPHELWTERLLAKHIQTNCVKQGFPEVVKISPGTISKILGASNIKPHKIASYIHRRDPEFETKSVLVLHTYKKVELIKEMKKNGKEVDIAIVSYDEKPGLQAIGNKHPDLMPVEGKYPTLSRDYEYIRYGTISLLAGIDLLTGIIHYQVHEQHRSQEFIDFLKQIDSYYPREIKIVVILDNHKVHTSQETQKYLETVPQRFQFVFTPKHASWLNIIESLFSKMTRTLLRGIRVTSKEELIARICQYFDEINETPVIFKWKYKMDEMPGKIEAL